MIIWDADDTGWTSLLALVTFGPYKFMVSFLHGGMVLDIIDTPWVTDIINVYETYTTSISQYLSSPHTYQA